MKHMPPGPPPWHDKKQKFPPELCNKLNESGLSTEEMLFCCMGDMDNEACYTQAWLFFDPKGLYIAFGTEKTDKKKHGKKPHIPEFFIDKIMSIPHDDIDNLKIEQYTSTGRLLMCKDVDELSLVRFSISKLDDFNSFIQAYNSYRETGKVKIDEKRNDGPRKCSKCGAPCPPGKMFCRKHNKTGTTALRLLKLFNGHIPQMAIITLSMIIGSVISAYIPQISTRALYDDVLSNAGDSPASQVVKALGTLVLSIIGIRILNMIIQIFQQYLTASIMPKIMYDIKLKIFESMQKLSVGFYSSKQTGSLMDRVSRDSMNVYWFFVDGIPALIIHSATIIGVVAIMFSMSAKLTLIILCSMPFLGIVLVLGDRFFRSRHHRLWVFRSKMDSMLSDNINGQRVIKAFSKENDEYERMDNASSNLKNAEIDLAVNEATLLPILEIIVSALVTAVMGIGAVMVVSGEGNMTAGTLLSFIVYLEMLKEPFRFLAWVSNWWARCADSAQRIFEICDAQPEILEKENAVSLENVKGDIEISDLDFEYEPARPVIKKMSLKIDAGNMLGIVGKTGSGKTTIASLISRLYDAKEGSIKIDGIDVRDIKLEDLHKNVGMVSQDIYLFYGTIADNIRYAKPDADMGEVIAAAKAACAHDFIMKLPDAYETRVGAGGQKLSGGERQRISIARTIIQNPRILILDEATAAMDTETERSIQNSLNQLTQGRTTIAIAHRLSTLRESDYMAVIQEGQIVEQGTYAELMALKGEFFKQYKIQSEALKTIGIFEEDHKHVREEGEEND